MRWHVHTRPGTSMETVALKADNSKYMRHGHATNRQPAAKGEQWGTGKLTKTVVL